ncbi:hypothetical protein DFH11DRAFT_1731515 [Phellopilus nigrolimitatus]|nr:hypothetical protein DFH11DRAFT_1731515 [Phellopilus nigrolimitatus]
MFLSSTSFMPGSQPITIPSRSQGQGQCPGWGIPGMSPRSGDSTSDYAIHPDPIFVSNSFGTSLGFGSDLFPNSSAAGQLLNSLDPKNFRCRISSSIESDHSALVSPHMSEREIEQFQNFACCGLPFADLHHLIEHFEKHHVFVVNSCLPPSSTNMLTCSSDSSLADALGQGMPAASGSSLSPSMAGGVTAFDPDEMELDLEADGPPSSSHSSPEAAGVSFPTDVPSGPSAFFNVHFTKKSSSMVTSQIAHPYAGARPSPSGYILHVGQSQAQSNAALVANVLNGYSGYSDYSCAFPGTLCLCSSKDMGPVDTPASTRANSTDGMNGQANDMIRPSLLFGGSWPSTSAPSAASARTELNTATATSSQSRASSPSNAAPTASPSAVVRKAESSSTLGTPSTMLSQRAPLLSKPFKCPKPGCMKSYKQANGLKYHVTHGKCNFNPPPESIEGSHRERGGEDPASVPLARYRRASGATKTGTACATTTSTRATMVDLVLFASGKHDVMRSQPSSPAISLDTSGGAFSAPERSALGGTGVDMQLRLGRRSCP